MGGSDASLLYQQLDGRLASADSLRTADRFCLKFISSADEALCDLVTLFFMALRLFSEGGRHAAAVAELFYLIEILE